MPTDVGVIANRTRNGGGACGWSRAWVVALGARFFNTSVVNQYFTTQLGECSWNKSMLNMGGSTPFQIDANFGLPAGLVEVLVQSHEWVKLPSAAPGNGSTRCGNSSSGAQGGSWTTGSNGRDLAAAFTGDLDKAPLIRLLPALPPQWAATGGSGSVKGTVTRGGFVIDLSWDQNARIRNANITSRLGGPVCVTAGQSTIGSAAEGNGTGIAIAEKGSGAFVCMQTTPGNVYSITPQ